MKRPKFWHQWNQQVTDLCNKALHHHHFSLISRNRSCKYPSAVIGSG